MPADATPPPQPRAVRAGLPGPWRIVFAVEILICLGTCLLWLLAPAEYLGRFLGKRPHDVADYLLLQQSTAVVFPIFVYFYGRVLVSRRVDLRTSSGSPERSSAPVPRLGRPVGWFRHPVLLDEAGEPDRGVVPDVGDGLEGQ
jgi:hypothetical protein